MLYQREARLRIIFFKGDDGMKKAEEALSKIKGGADFADMSKKHSEDPTAKDGGDIGFVKRGTCFLRLRMPPFPLKRRGEQCYQGRCRLLYYQD